jgi:hypothetical protein
MPTTPKANSEEVISRAAAIALRICDAGAKKSEFKDSLII